MLAPLGLSLLAMLLGARTLDVLQFGDEQAATLGVRVARARLLLTCAATLAAAVAVSVAGLIGFVGLVVPHAARLLVGPGHRRLLLFSALLGAAFLIAADAVARGLPGPTETPVGVVTAAVGGPFFLALLHRARRGSPW
jgi:iron complex transport system permease protein